MADDAEWGFALGGSAKARSVGRGGDKKPAKTGATSDIRLDIIKGVKSQIDVVASRKSKSKQGNRLLLPIFTTVASLVTCLESTAKSEDGLAAEAEATLDCVTPLLSRDPLSTLLILIEPHKMPNRVPLISDEFLTFWQEADDEVTNRNCIEIYSAILARYAVAAPAAVEAAVETLRGEVDKLFVKVKKATEKEEAIESVFKFIRSSYEKLATGGVIARQRLYPATLCKQLTSDRLIWMDNLRFSVGMRISQRGISSAQTLHMLIDSVSDSMPGNDYLREQLPFMALDAFAITVVPPLLELNKWVNSTAFFYYLGDGCDVSRGSIDPRDTSLLDVDGAIMDSLSESRGRDAAGDSQLSEAATPRYRSHSRGRERK